MNIKGLADGVWVGLCECLSPDMQIFTVSMTPCMFHVINERNLTLASKIG